MATPSSLWDARSHLRQEMACLVGRLARHLSRLRQRGKSAASEALKGFVIEDGEAEGIMTDLAVAWTAVSSDGPALEPSPPLTRDPAPLATDQSDTGQVFLPLRHAARKFDLSAVEYDALLLALAVELDGRFGRLVAYLNDHVGQTRPTVGLALGLGSVGPGGDPLSPLAFCERPSVRDGLLELEGDGPVPGRVLCLSRHTALRLGGDARADEMPEGFRYFAPERGFLQRLVLERSVRGHLTAWAQSLSKSRPAVPLVLSGARGAGRTTVARAVMSELGWPLLVADIGTDCMPESLRRARGEVRWHGAPLLVRVASPRSVLEWSALWTGLAQLDAPLVIAVTPELTEALLAAATAEPAVVRLSDPTLAARAELWRAILPARASLDRADLDHLAAQFRFNPGRIEQVVRRATAAASMADTGGDGLTAAALKRACHEVGSASMGGLAQKLPLPYAWSELVVPPAVSAELELARTWVAQQRKVLEDWGFAGRLPMGSGLTMLFSGPPGTGKTMAAQVLARELDLELYRVDLSRVVSKYIGETEKNLARLFDEAQTSGAILLFDEADALFGKRSEVKDAHDRYANLEIGYLLQRMEEYEGVTILASNRSRDMDEAFTRRFQFIVDFPMPDEKLRLEIWKGMFPALAERETDLDFAALARDFEMSGGEIKNAVLAAAYIAAGKNRPIAMPDLRRAVRREFGKSGRVLSDRHLG